MEKLTFREIVEFAYCASSGNETVSATLAKQIWSRIEADREAIREEMKKEMQNCFRIGELIEVLHRGEWEEAIIVARQESGVVFTVNDTLTRGVEFRKVYKRKTRPMTREEMEKKLWMTRQTDDQLRAMLATIGESSEVEE